MKTNQPKTEEKKVPNYRDPAVFDEFKIIRIEDNKYILQVQILRPLDAPKLQRTHADRLRDSIAREENIILADKACNLDEILELIKKYNLK